MKIPCVSCNSIFRLDSGILKPTGSLVKCSKCHFIFIVHPQNHNEQPITQDTNIDQSILFDLFSIEHASRTELPLDDISEEWNKLLDQGVLSIEDFDEEVPEESDSNILDTECTDLPDLSEYENMIDWGDNTDSKQPSAADQRKNSINAPTNPVSSHLSQLNFFGFNKVLKKLLSR